MFNLLQTFLTVYETRNFTQAAEQLFISQPTVTTHIQKLEHELQAELFIRENKRVMPTAVADQFYPQAQQMLAEWRTTKQSLSHAPNNAHGSSLGLRIQRRPPYSRKS